MLLVDDFEDAVFVRRVLFLFFLFSFEVSLTFAAALPLRPDFFLSAPDWSRFEFFDNAFFRTEISFVIFLVAAETLAVIRSFNTCGSAGGSESTSIAVSSAILLLKKAFPTDLFT